MNWFAIYWGVAIAALPLFIKMQGTLRARDCRDMTFVALVFLSIVLFGFRKKLWSDYKYIIIGFSVLSFLSYFNQYNIFSYRVIHQWFCINAGLMLALQMIANFNEKDKKIIGTGMFIAGISQSVLMISSYFDYDMYAKLMELVTGIESIRVEPTTDGAWMPSAGKLPIVGTLGNPNIASALVAASIPAFLNKKLYYFLPLSLFAVYISDSMLAIAGAIVGMLAFFSFKYLNKKQITIAWITVSLFCAGIFVISVLYKWSFIGSGNRLNVWIKSITWIRNEKILYGVGPGFFGDMFRIYFSEFTAQYGEAFAHPHNAIVSLYVCFGIVGLICLAVVLKEIWNIKKDPIIISCLIAVCVNAMGNLTFHISSLALIAITCFSLTMVNKSRSLSK